MKAILVISVVEPGGLIVQGRQFKIPDLRKQLVKSLWLKKTLTLSLAVIQRMVLI
jgi:hypothetical protein